MPRRLAIQRPRGVARLNLKKGRKVTNTKKSHFILVSLMCDSVTSAEFATSRGRTVADSGKSRLMEFRCAATQRTGYSVTSPIEFSKMKRESGNSMKYQTITCMQSSLRALTDNFVGTFDRPACVVNLWQDPRFLNAERHALS